MTGFMIASFFIIASFSSIGFINQAGGEEEEEEETLRPNLYFDGGIQHPEQVEPGVLTTLKVRVENNGQVDAQDIVVMLTLNGEEVERKYLSEVPLSQPKFVAFNWMTAPGTNYLEVVIDPDNTINEINENDNVINSTIEVDDPDPKEKEERTEATPGFGAVGFLLMMITCLFLITRKNSH